MDDDIEMVLEASDDQKEIALILRSPNPIDMSMLILSLESYLMELTRAEADKRRPGVEMH